MKLNSRGLALIISAIIASITTGVLYLVPDVSKTALTVTFFISFFSAFVMIRILAEFYFFREINNIYQALSNIQDKELASIPKKQKSYFNPLRKINQEISSYASRKQGEIDELKKMSLFRREFIADVSHELKTPIFAAQGFVHTLIDGAVEDKQVRTKFLKKAAKSLDGLDILVQDLLTISQIESGEINMHYENFNLVNLCNEVVDQLEVKASKKGTTIEIKKTSGSASVHADYRRIYQVVLNLTTNAINYSSDHSKIVIKLSTENNKVLFQIKDNGKGIPEEDIHRIFERFYRVDKSRSKEKGGTGLGLSIVKHIVESHNSEIFVESTLKKGSKFWFYLQPGIKQGKHEASSDQ